MLYIPRRSADGDGWGTDPSIKTATHTTSVPLYSGLAVMVRVYTRAPSSSLPVPGVISGKEFCVTKDPFTLQTMPSAVGWRHQNTANTPIYTSCEDGTSVKPIDTMHTLMHYLL